MSTSRCKFLPLANLYFRNFTFLTNLYFCCGSTSALAKPAPRWQKLMKAKHKAGLICEENKI